MKKPILLLTLAISLAGCSAQSISDEAGDGKTVQIAPQRLPGNWTMLNYTMAFDATGVEGGMAEMVKAGQASIGQKQFGGPECLTAEATGKDDLTARLNEGIRFGPEWKVVRSGIKDGMVDFAATMDDPQQGKGEMTITGKLTPTTTDLLITTDAWQPAPGKGHIHTVLKQENTRVGDCG